MSNAIRELLNNSNVAASYRPAGIQGNFPVDEAVLEGRKTTYMPCVTFTEGVL